MSKIGKIPIQIPDKVEVLIDGRAVVVNGPKGKNKIDLPGEIDLKKEKDILIVSVKRKDKASRALHGAIRSHLANMIKGVNEGWIKQLELVGTGYRAQVEGSTLVLTVGFIQPVKIEAPEGIVFKVEKTMITIEGVDKQVVGEVAANVRAIRPPEPYQGKGIRYKDEVIIKKPGKAAKAGEAAAGS